MCIKCEKWHQLGYFRVVALRRYASQFLFASWSDIFRILLRVRPYVPRRRWLGPRLLASTAPAWHCSHQGLRIILSTRVMISVWFIRRHPKGALSTTSESCSIVSERRQIALQAISPQTEQVTAKSDSRWIKSREKCIFNINIPCSYLSFS